MGWLRDEDVESLIAAYGAERVGRPPTEREEAARRTYTEVLGRECRSAGIRPTAGTDLVGVIAHGVSRVLAYRMRAEELQLCRSGLLAPHDERQASEQETAAMRAYHSEIERISVLAGFSSVADYYAFRKPTRVL